MKRTSLQMGIGPSAGSDRNPAAMFTCTQVASCRVSPPRTEVAVQVSGSTAPSASPPVVGRAAAAIVSPVHYLRGLSTVPAARRPVRAERHGYLECLSMTLEMGPAGDLVRVRRIDEDEQIGRAHV